MIKKVGVLFLAAVLVFSFSGCRFVSSDVSKTNVILAFGIDGEEGNYSVSVRVFEASSPESGRDAKTTVFKGGGKTLSQAVDSLTSSIGNTPVLSQSSVIIIGRETAEKGIGEILRYFMYDDYIGPSAAVIVSLGSAADIITSEALDNFLPTDRFTNMINAAWKDGAGVNTKFAEAVAANENKFADFCLPTARINSEKHIVTDSAAVFKNGALYEIIKPDIIKGLLFLNNNIQGGYISAETAAGEKAAFQIVNSSSKIKADMEKGVLSVSAEIKADVKLTETVNGSFSEKVLDELCEDAEREILFLTENAYKNVITQRECDPVNIGRRLYTAGKLSPETRDEEFRALLSKSQFRGKVNVRISRSGMF